MRIYIGLMLPDGVTTLLGFAFAGWLYQSTFRPIRAIVVYQASPLSRCDDQPG